MYLTLQIHCDRDRMWDHICVRAHDRNSYSRVYDRNVYVGESRQIALNKAILELEVLAVDQGWLDPGELS